MSEEQYKKNVHETAIKNCDSFFEQLNKRIEDCKNKEEVEYVKDSTLNFLIFAILNMLGDHDQSAREAVASHIHRKILALKDNL